MIYKSTFGLLLSEVVDESTFDPIHSHAQLEDLVGQMDPTNPRVT